MHTKLLPNSCCCAVLNNSSSSPFEAAMRICLSFPHYSQALSCLIKSNTLLVGPISSSVDQKPHAIGSPLHLGPPIAALHVLIGKDQFGLCDHTLLTTGISLCYHFSHITYSPATGGASGEHSREVCSTSGLVHVTLAPEPCHCRWGRNRLWKNCHAPLSWLLRVQERT